MLRQLLEVDVSQRITAGMILRHPWLQSQLAMAPDIAKLRLDTAILISDKPDDDIDDATMDELMKFGMGKEEILRQVFLRSPSITKCLFICILDTDRILLKRFRRS